MKNVNNSHHKERLFGDRSGRRFETRPRYRGREMYLPSYLRNADAFGGTTFVVTGGSVYSHKHPKSWTRTVMGANFK